MYSDYVVKIFMNHNLLKHVQLWNLGLRGGVWWCGGGGAGGMTLYYEPGMYEYVIRGSSFPPLLGS